MRCFYLDNDSVPENGDSCFDTPCKAARIKRRFTLSVIDFPSIDGDTHCNEA